MTLPEWTATIVAEARAAGFEVSEYQGFPLVQRPKDPIHSVRFLKHTFSMPVERSIYAEGCLLPPAGITVDDARPQRTGRSRRSCYAAKL